MRSEESKIKRPRKPKPEPLAVLIGRLRETALMIEQKPDVGSIGTRQLKILDDVMRCPELRNGKVEDSDE